MMMQIDIIPTTEDILLENSSGFGKTTLLQKNDKMCCYLGLGQQLLVLEDIRVLGGFAWKEISTAGDSQADMDFGSIAKQTPDDTMEQVSSSFMEGWHMAAYQFTSYKQHSKQLPHLSVNSSDEVFAACDKEALHKADAVHFARDLRNEPASELTPALYAERLKQEFAQTDAKGELIEDEALTSEKFPDIHTIAKGSREAAELGCFGVDAD